MVFSRSAIALLILIAAAALPVSAAATSEVLPPAASVEGWQLSDRVRTYAPDHLYDYIDGNADLFRSYGFADLAVGEYSPAEAEGRVTVDVFNMGTPLQAFGIFGAERPPDVNSMQLGAQGYESNGLIAFWKGPYYVKVSLVEGKDKQAAQRLAQVAAGRIAAEEAMPAELRRLPSEGRIAGSERYVKKGALGHWYLRDAVSAQYNLGEVAGPEHSRTVATLYICDLRARGPSAASVQRLRRFYAEAGASVAPAPGVTQGAFAARDELQGETVVARAGKFVVIATSEKAPREQVVELAKAGIAASTAAQERHTRPPAGAPVGGSAAAGTPAGR